MQVLKILSMKYLLHNFLLSFLSFFFFTENDFIKVVYLDIDLYLYPVGFFS